MTTQETIDALTVQITTLTAERSRNLAQIPKEQQSYRDWLAKGNWTEAHRHSDAVDVMVTRNTAITVLLATLGDSLKNAQTQRQTELSAAQKVIETTPTSAQTTALALDASAQATKTKTYTIVAVVVVIVVILGFIYIKFIR